MCDNPLQYCSIDKQYYFDQTQIKRREEITDKEINSISEIVGNNVVIDRLDNRIIAFKMNGKYFIIKKNDDYYYVQTLLRSPAFIFHKCDELIGLENYLHSNN